MAKINSNDNWKFTGRYRNAAAELAEDGATLLGCSNEQAMRLGMAFMADWGKVQSWRRKGEEGEDIKLTVSAPKVSGDGEVTATEVEKIQRLGKATPAISIFSALQQFNKIRKYGFSYSQTKLVLVSHLNDWLFQTGEYAPQTEKKEATELVNS